MFPGLVPESFTVLAVFQMRNLRFVKAHRLALNELEVELHSRFHSEPS